MVLEVGPIIGITEVFVITSGRNVRQVRTIAEEIEKKLKEEGHTGPIRTEGLREAAWVLLDYGDFVVHVFLEETEASTTSTASGPTPPTWTGRNPRPRYPEGLGNRDESPKASNLGEIRRSLPFRS